MSDARSRLVALTKQLASHVNEGRHADALSLFIRMRSMRGLCVDTHVYPLAVKSSAALGLRDLTYGILSLSIKLNLLSNPFVSSSLISSLHPSSAALRLLRQLPSPVPTDYSAAISSLLRSSEITSAVHLFHSMPLTPSPSSFNSLISALSAASPATSIAFFRLMPPSDVSLITLLSVIPSLASLAALRPLKQSHATALRRSFLPHPHLHSSLVESYGRCASLAYARRVFDQIPHPDVVAWSAMVSAYALHGDAHSALDTFSRMIDANVRPDGVAFLGVLKACSHAGLPGEAVEYFEMMQGVYGVEVSKDHYSCLVDVLSRAGRLREAYEVIRGMPMEAGVKAWGALLAACKKFGDVELGEVAGRALFELEPGNAGNYVQLASVYAAVGRFEEAEKVREEMRERKMMRAPGSSWIVA